MYQSWVTFGGDSKFQVRAIVLVEQVCNSELISLTCSAIRERERERERDKPLAFLPISGKSEGPLVAIFAEREREENGFWV